MLLYAAVSATGYVFTLSVGGLFFAIVLLVILFGTVFAAVHHAEVIAERVGEPYGTLVLTLSVTIIEVALITTIMLGDKPAPELARDTVFAVVMIVCNGLVGLCIFIGGLRYREQGFQLSGANVYLSVLFALATITLIMPNYTTTTPGPVYSAIQLGFVDVVTLALYGVFLYTQTVLHKDYFVHEREDGRIGEAHLSGRTLVLSVVLLLIALLAVVLLSKKFSLVVDAVAARIGAPPAFAGLLVALLILLPEGVAAVSAARKNDLQKSINLALGSSLATIGLTFPAVGVATYALDKELKLGLSAQGSVLLLLTFFLSMLTFGTGRTNVLLRAGPYGGICRLRVHGFRALNRFSGSCPRRVPMLAAKSEVQVDNEQVRVTEWRLAPNSATGHHTHGMDYVIVPIVAGEMTIVAPNDERSKAQLAAGKSYFRKAGVQHDVLNETATEIVFLEIELKP
ncbi:Ca2+:H+ antiporter [Bradyrhizobium sp. LB1.3]